jgi:hypothetical protein
MGDAPARVIFAPRRRLSDRITGLRVQVEHLQRELDLVALGLRCVAAELDELAAEQAETEQ